MAVALANLHAALRNLAPPQRTVVDDLQATIHALDDDSFASGLGPADRALLQHGMRAAVEIAGSVTSRIHGSPHRSNVVSAHGVACFIVLETITRRPLEWDLAHLEPEVAVAYSTNIDTEVLQRCRIAVSARTAAQCWHHRDRGPDMIWHARHHLDVVRQGQHVNRRPTAPAERTSACRGVPEP